MTSGPQPEETLELWDWTSEVDARQLTMTVDEYAAALFMDSLELARELFTQEQN